MTRVRRVAFVVGCPRSGTTLVQQLLNAHPDIVIGPETHFVRRFREGREKYGDLSSDEGWGRLVRDVAAMPELGDIGIAPERVMAAAAGLERHPARLLRLLLDLFAGDAAVAGEKTPGHLLHMPLLQEWFPEARFIHVVRDPRAVVNSMRRVPWSSGTLVGDAAVWRGQIYRALRKPPAAGRLLTVAYERLVAEPEAEVARVCAFLGVPYDARVVAPDRGAPVGVDVDREPWKRNAAGPIVRGPADRWRGELTPAQVYAIEAAAGGALRRMGYAPTGRLPRRLAGPPVRALDRIRRWWRRRGDRRAAP